MIFLVPMAEMFTQTVINSANFGVILIRRNLLTARDDLRILLTARDDLRILLTARDGLRILLTASDQITVRQIELLISLMALSAVLADDILSNF